ncbi:hypothetical protein SAMN05444266_10584 [Chitinophaga jiangningensis]|uniref:Uncharacterized protein n=1 Tax=Chitinophaga jiangningensis TaxID=1419482 RepID=A0A1M7DQ49_9BACT|nr:hypothetical protein [Chitinophaga jiangningensis]SHL81503.1 hypothetical protein SAMN05444266_10584 [Chitinophaga jiangningensis]
MEISYFEAIFDSLYHGPQDLQPALAAMKEAGASQIKTVMVLIRKLGLTLPEADDVILEAEAWKDEREATLRLRNGFWEVCNGEDEIEEDQDKLQA